MTPGVTRIVARTLAVAGITGLGFVLSPVDVSPAAAGTSPTVVEAHAGGAGVQPGDSLEAITAAIKAGADVIEMDVQYTLDHVAVINHGDKIASVTPAEAATDGVLPRRCDHVGSLLHLMTYAQAQLVRCSGQPLATLAQGIDLVKPSTARIDLEIKTFDDIPGGTTLVQSPASRREYATRAVTQMNASGMKGRFFVSSFAWRASSPQ